MPRYVTITAVCLLLAAMGACTSVYHIPAGSPGADKPISTSSPYNPPSSGK